MVPARLNVVTLGARDLPRLREFYAALGWEIAIEADDFCAFRLGGIFLGLFPSDMLAADGQTRAAPRTDGMRGFSLGINVERPAEVDEIVAAVEKAGAHVTKRPGDPVEFEGRNAYFADPEENYWEVVYLKGGLQDQGSWSDAPGRRPNSSAGSASLASRRWAVPYGATPRSRSANRPAREGPNC